jgi:uncharacterized protein
MSIALMIMLGAAPGASPATPAIANPASVYCVQQGGRVEIVNTPQGQVGYCILPDGRRIEEWAFFRSQKDQTGR